MQFALNTYSHVLPAPQEDAASKMDVAITGVLWMGLG